MRRSSDIPRGQGMFFFIDFSAFHFRYTARLAFNVSVACWSPLKCHCSHAVATVAKSQPSYIQLEEKDAARATAPDRAQRTADLCNQRNIPLGGGSIPSPDHPIRAATLLHRWRVSRRKKLPRLSLLPGLEKAEVNSYSLSKKKRWASSSFGLLILSLLTLPRFFVQSACESPGWDETDSRHCPSQRYVVPWESFTSRFTGP